MVVDLHPWQSCGVEVSRRGGLMPRQSTLALDLDRSTPEVTVTDLLVDFQVDGRVTV